MRASERVNVCHLVQHPETFKGKIISVRAVVSVAFEEFEIVVPDCSSRLIDGIWLEYGSGPKNQPTVWCCGDITPHDPLEVVQDAAFQRFDTDLRAVRNGKPIYKVTANLTGRFDSVPVKLCPDKKHYCPREAGFGHFGLSAARLVIHSVSEIKAVER
jgi:hypothetical protein